MNTNWRVAHTGEWRASCQRIDVAHEVYVEVVEGERTVALVVASSPEHYGVDEADLDARTRLVQSAPELRGSLRALLELLTRNRIAFSEDDWPTVYEAQRVFVAASPKLIISPGVTLDALMRRRARRPEPTPTGIDSEGGAPD